MISILRLATLAMGLTALSFAAPINVALNTNGGSATQSSTYPGGPASNANDGNTSGSWGVGSVSHTNSDTNAWWQVTFDASYLISDINIFNRTDCCGDRLNPYSVFLYDAANAQVWTSGPGQTIGLPATSASFVGINVVAKSLKVQLDLANYLQLAEVEAMGEQTTSVVPEPSTYALMAGGLVFVGMLRRRKQ